MPRQFDPYLGDDRLDRAQAFDTLRIPVKLGVFPDIPHALTPAMEQAAIAFLAEQSALTA